MVTIADFILNLQAYGIFDFYLPFFILFAIFYALLTKSHIFGDPKDPVPRKINLILSMGAAAYVTLFPIFGMPPLGPYLAKLFGQTFIVIMSILAVLLIGYVLLTPLGVEMKAGKKVARIFAGGLVILGIILFIGSGGLAYFQVMLPTSLILPPWGLALTTEDIAILSLIVITGLVVYWFYKGPKEKKEKEEEKKPVMIVPPR